MVFIATSLVEALSLITASKLLDPTLYSVARTCINSLAISLPVRLFARSCIFTRRCSLVQSLVTKRTTITSASPSHVVPSNITETFFHLFPSLLGFPLPSVQMAPNLTYDACLSSERSFPPICLKNVAACLMVLLLGETFGQLLLDRFAALLAGFHQPNGTDYHNPSVLLLYLFPVYPLPGLSIFH